MNYTTEYLLAKIKRLETQVSAMQVALRLTGTSTSGMRGVPHAGGIVPRIDGNGGGGYVQYINDIGDAK